MTTADRDECATHDHRFIESRRHLCGVIKGWARQGGIGYDTLADAILHSQWLAAHDRAVEQRTLKDARDDLTAWAQTIDVDPEGEPRMDPHDSGMRKGAFEAAYRLDQLAQKADR